MKQQIQIQERVMVQSRRYLVTALAILALVCLVLFSILAASPARSQVAGGITAESGDEAALSGALDEIAFVAGGRVVVDAQSSDDIYVAGGNVMARNATTPSMTAAGGDVMLTDVSIEDLRIAAGTARFVSGAVGDDVVAFAGQLTFAPEFSVSGSAVLAGGEVRLEAPVGGELRAGGGYVLIDSQIGGDVTVAGDRVVIGPNARIGGSLSHRSDQIEIDPGAVITGEIRELEVDEPAPLRARDIILAAAVAFFGAFVALVLLAWLAAVLLPGLMRDADAMIRKQPWKTLAVGFLIGLVAPGLLLLLLVSIIGIPVALTLAALLVAAIPLAIAAFVNFAGLMIRRILNKDRDEAPSLPARALWSAVAVVALVVIGLVPFIGPIAWTAAYVTGLGAVATQGARSLARGVRPEMETAAPQPGL